MSRNLAEIGEDIDGTRGEIKAEKKLIKEEVKSWRELPSESKNRVVIGIEEDYKESQKGLLLKEQQSYGQWLSKPEREKELAFITKSMPVKYLDEKANMTRDSEHGFPPAEVIENSEE